MKRKVAQTIKKIATKVSMLIIISFLFTTNNTDAQCNVSSPSWCTLGNSGTTAGTNFVGTLDLQPLVFKANDSEWMRVTTTGNVGIGTTLPSTQLHTTGGVRFQTLTGTGNRIVVTDLNGNLSAGSATTSGVVTGSGTLNYLPKWTPDGATLGNSSIFDNGNVGIGTTSPQAKLEVKNGSVLFNGTSGSTPVNGPGTRMMWIPYKAAFRAGNAGGLNAWNDANIGYYSAAFGINTKASGWFSTAFGGGTIASGTGSTAFGYNNTASGHYSSTFGFGSTANAYGSFVIGQYNAISGNPGTWFPADPLFIIGNGISSSARSNAMTVLKNGKVGIGTSTPTEKLDVAGNIRINGNQIYLAWDNFHGLGYFNTYAGKTIDGPVLYGYSGGALGTKQGGTQNVALYWNSNGNVGIGTSCPNERLTVNGKIKARYEVYVQDTEGFCDYVFEETYKRPTYLEKEIWFKKNKRLYNMPSEKEIMANGLPVVTAIKSLTLNTEENSLDIVELYKIVKNLEKENEVLKQVLIKYGFEMGAGIIQNTKK